MTGGRGNGHLPPQDRATELDADDVEDEPLEPEEAAAGAAIADEGTDETLDERVGTVVEELEAVERRREAGGVVYLVRGRPFALLGDERLEVLLDGPVATAALRTPDTSRSSRGPGWVAFAPRSLDRFALDRADAWLRAAYRSGARR